MSDGDFYALAGAAFLLFFLGMQLPGPRSNRTAPPEETEGPTAEEEHLRLKRANEPTEPKPVVRAPLPAARVVERKP